MLDEQQLVAVAARIEGINPADLTRQINTIQMRLLDHAKAKTEAIAAARHVDIEALQPSIEKMASGGGAGERASGAKPAPGCAS